jgi:peroxiredoxin family protein
MAEEQKNSTKGFQNFCSGMDFAEIMRKMMEAKMARHPFDCAEMMSQMKQMCGAGKKREGSTPETKENPAPHP